jgi:hypothetical protein
VRRLRAFAQIAVTAILVMVTALGVLGSARLASACMRLSLREAPCCAAMRAPVRLQGENSCCHGGRLDRVRAADASTTRVDVAPAAWVAQPAWSSDWLPELNGTPRSAEPRGSARPPPRPPHLAFTILRC